MKDPEPRTAAHVPDVSGLRAHFFAVSAQLIRRILVERVRHRNLMRFFGGLSVEETAEVIKTSPRTVIRDSNAAKAWLYGELRGAPDGSSPMEIGR